MAELFSILTYDYTKVTDVLDIGEVYEPVVSVLTPSRAAGVYEVGFDLEYNYNTTSQSAFIRWTHDGGNTWRQSSEEGKDNTDNKIVTHTVPIVHTGGVIDFRVEMSKESPVGTLDVAFAGAWVARVN